jgi:3-deoxy-7-phosphoheptulonate synthase
MLIVTRAGITEPELAHICERVESLGLRTHVSRGQHRVVIGCVGEEAVLAGVPLLALPGVESVTPVQKPYTLASRDWAADPARATTVTLGANTTPTPCVVGGHAVAVIAGPCSVESRDMLQDTAHLVRAAGATALRGGAFKPRSSPYAFQGLGAAALELLVEARATSGLPIVTEVLDPRQVELVAASADCLQVGARNMQNFALLAEVGKTRTPVLLKRGLSATIKELLMAAEYVLAQGNRQVILCERGIRTFETATRNTLDIAAVPVLKSETHLPVLVDPSHAAGRSRFVAALAYAGIAAGADGLLIEVHPSPEAALSDGDQSLTPAAFTDLMRHLRAFAEAAGRSLPRTVWESDPQTAVAV